MQEEANGDLVHLNRFRKRQDFANEAAQTLAEGVIETLDMMGKSPLGILGAVLTRG